MRILEVVAAQPDHVAAGDRVSGGVDVDHAHLGPPGLRIEQLAEGDGHEVASLEGDHHRVASREEMLGRAVAEVARVLHVEGDRIRASQLVADVLGHDGGLDAQGLEPLAHVVLQHLADVHFLDAQVSVGVPLHVVELGKVLRVQLQDQALGDDRDPVPPAVAHPLDDRARERVHEGLEPHLLVRELFGDEGDGGAGGLADPQGQMPGLAAHRDHVVPARGRLRVDHQVLHDVDAEVARGLEAEGVDVRRQVEVVVDRLRHVHDLQPPGRLLLQLHGRESGVVAADRDELGHPHAQQGQQRVLHVLGVGGGVGAGDADVGAAPEVDPADVFDPERDDMVDVALHDPLEAVPDAQDLDVLELGPDRGRANDAVDAGGGSAADQDGQLVLHSLSPAANDSFSLAFNSMNEELI